MCYAKSRYQFFGKLAAIGADFAFRNEFLKKFSTTNLIHILTKLGKNYIKSKLASSIKIFKRINARAVLSHSGLSEGYATEFEGYLTNPISSTNINGTKKKCMSAIMKTICWCKGKPSSFQQDVAAYWCCPGLSAPHRIPNHSVHWFWPVVT